MRETGALQAVLVVEDDDAQRLALVDRLKREGFVVEAARDGETGLAQALSGRYDVVVLDVMLPRRNGFDIANELRASGVESRILMLTARGEVTDKVVGLGAGADDYLTKPFEFIEFMARLHALLRRGRHGGTPVAVLELGDVRVDFVRAEASRDNEEIVLSAREFGLLRYLAERRGEVVTRDELLRAVWGYRGETSTRTVDVHVARLRQKLEPTTTSPLYLLTVRGQGYKLARA